MESPAFVGARKVNAIFIRLKMQPAGNAPEKGPPLRGRQLGQLVSRRSKMEHSLLSLNQKKNSWSCLPIAFATALNIPTEAILIWLGHDGSEVVLAGLPEPLNRRGFHPQELIAFCLESNIAVTQVDLIPSGAGSKNEIHPRKFTIGKEDPIANFHRHLFNSKGVLGCRKMAGLGHALSYVGHRNHAIIKDPGTSEVFEYKSLEDCEKRNLYLTNLWRLDPIDKSMFSV